MPFENHLPLDPDCPEVTSFHDSLWNDPMTLECGIGDEITEHWEPKHRSRCERCREFGCANIEVVGP